jgi:ABC-type transporter Mla MlaB component
MMSRKHYTQEESVLRTFTRADAKRPVLHVHGGGFVTRKMLARTLRSLPDEEFAPTQILVDLRDVAGYDSDVVQLAAEWLRTARDQGVQRIAFVANSAVVRTATRLASEHAGITLRTFSDHEEAHRWLSV